MKLHSFVSLACLVPLAAQLPPAAPEEPRGPFAAIAHGLSLANQAGANSVLFKTVGDQTSAPAVPPVPIAGAPNFAMTTLFGGQASYFDLDAMSTGNDLIPVNEEGMIVPDENNGWVAITFSVTTATTDVAGTIVNLRSQMPQPSHGADLFGYFLLDSNTDPSTLGVPAELVGRAFLQQGVEHSAIATPAEMDGHDAFMPYVAAGVIPDDLGLLRTVDRFFFSVTQLSATAINQARTPGSVLANWFPQPVSAATVYGMHWTSSGWSAPYVLRSASSLDLDPEEDIDALAVDYTNEDGIVVLFSTTTTTRPQLLLALPNSGGSEARTPIGPVKLVAEGDVDAICTYDPESGEGFNPYIAFPYAVAGFSPKIGLSAAGDGLAYQVIASGWSGPKTAGAMSLYMLVGGIWYPLVTSQQRSTTDHSMQFSFTLPSPPPAGAMVDLLAVFEPEFNGLHQPSWMVRLMW